jgi:hypothetical protein
VVLDGERRFESGCIMIESMRFDLGLNDRWMDGWMDDLDCRQVMIMNNDLD